ncbi:MAG: MiaB/RimO family radical SAM methylthiotransferase [Desulfohalobiaceae bacterium]
MAERFFLKTLGCKINQYESQALREAWTVNGLVECADPARAHVVVVNTCAVTARAVQDVRSAVRRLHRLAPRADIVVTGCAAQVHGPELIALPGVTRLVPQAEKEGLLASPLSHPRPLPVRDTSWPGFAISGYNRSRAVLKIQDGCSHRCTYCIVPHARGPARSRPPEDSLAEALRLARGGVMELIVSGTNLSQYGRDLAPGEDLWDFLTRLQKGLQDLPSPPRLRLSSLEPSQLGHKALATLARCSLVVPHLHLSLQSASPEVLRRMGRGHYSPDQVTGFVRDLHRVWPLFALGADFLLGFPGESEQDFCLTRDFAGDLPFSYGHVFSFSPRPGTPAASMPGRVPAPEVKQRSRSLRGELRGKKTAFLQRLCREPRLEVVLQGGSPAKGVSRHYAECLFDHPLPGIAPGALVAARPLGVVDGRIRVCLPEDGQ